MVIDGRRAFPNRDFPLAQFLNLFRHDNDNLQYLKPFQNNEPNCTKAKYATRSFIYMFVNGEILYIKYDEKN